MTRVDLHPEDLLDRAARGIASFADLARLEQHLAECAVCRVERELARQAAIDAAPRRDEALLVARLARDVNARLASPTARRPRRAIALAASAAVALGVVGGAAAATLAFVRAGTPSSAAPSDASRAASVVPRDEPPAKAPPEAPSAPSPEVAAPRVPEPPPSRPAAPTAAEPSSASELFSQANRARRDGKVTEAVRLYRALQERYPGSSEELVSRVSLGRLLLDRLGDSRGALLQFNAYLASPSGGALREEAMVGRALALGRLGRTAEEQAAWKAVLDAWPKSTYQRRARARLSELGAPAPADGDLHRAPSGKGVGGGAP
jgi:TolA-binding protein